jgi:hypothetical protein
LIGSIAYSAAETLTLEENSNEESQMRSFIALAIASGLAIAAAQPVLAQDRDDTKRPLPPRAGQTMDRDCDGALDRDRDRLPNQAQAPQRVNPNANDRGAIDRDRGRDRAEDRIMRDKTDDGAHDKGLGRAEDRDDMKR